MNNFHKYCIVVFFVLLTPIIQAQNNSSIELSGTILDVKTKRFIPYAHVSLCKSADTSFVKGTVADSIGRFLLHVDSVDAYLLKVSAFGYEDWVKPMNTPGPIALKPTGKNLSEVMIVDHHLLYDTDGEKEIYNVSMDPTVQATSLDKALQNVPGIEVDALGKITYRGVTAVDVWMNGRPTHLEQESLIQYIRSLPAEKVEKIELITNPSARYQSGGPILNIVTNNKFVDNNFLSVGVGGDSRPSIKPWISYVYSNAKVVANLYAGLEHRTSNIQYEGNSTLLWNSDTSRMENYSRKEKNLSNNPYVGFSLDYQIDSSRTLSTWGNYYHGNEPTSSTGRYFRDEFIYNPGNYAFAQTDSGDANYHTAEVGISYDRIFNEDGQELIAVFDANWMGGNANNHALRSFDYFPTLDFDRTNKSNRKSGMYYAEVIYNHPFETGTFVTVGLSSTLNKNFKSELEEYMQNGTALKDDLRSYDEAILSTTTAAYATIMQYLGRITFKVGLRAEYKDIAIDYFGHSTNFDYNAFYLIPSFHATYRTRSKHSFKLSFTRRCATPKASQLTPFAKYGYDAFSVGNPNLNNTYTSNFEAGWNKYFEGIGRLSATAYYRGISDEIAGVTRVTYDEVFQTVTSYNTFQNVGSSSAMGLEASLMAQSNAKWKGQIYANAFRYQYKAQVADDDWFEDQAFCTSLRLHGSYTPVEWMSLFVNANYASRTISLQADKAGSASLDLGVSFDLCKHRLSAYASLEDVFNSNQQAGNIFAGSYMAYSYTKYPTRFLLVGLTYRFGKMDLKDAAQTGEEFMKNSDGK